MSPQEKNLEPVKKAETRHGFIQKKKYNLKELLAGINQTNIRARLDFGAPIGKELL